MAFNNFPYTNFQDLNLDWVMRNVKTALLNSNDAVETANNLKDFVETYFDNLDVQQEINNKIDEMVESGEFLDTFDDLLTEITEEYVKQWMEDNITPTTPVVDASLTISGAAADAKVTGEELGDLKSALNYGKTATQGYILTATNSGHGSTWSPVGLPTDEQTAEAVSDWLDNHPEATTTVQDGAITYPKLNSSFAGATFTLAQFDGSTNEEKLYNALDEVTFGVILCGEIEINHIYTPKSTKDYRNITILGATITLNIDGWFQPLYSQLHTVPKFDSCNIHGNNHVFYGTSEFTVGPYFRNCSLRNVCICNNTTNGFLQSPYFIGCTMNPVENLFSVYALIDFRMIGCRVESATDTLCVVTGPNGVVSGSVIGTLIEGRHDVVFNISACYKFEIKDCYFEANLNGLLNQSTSGICHITVEDCTFLKPINVECAINITSGNYGASIIRNNLCNYASGHYICNKKPLLSTSLNQVNTNYLNNWHSSFGFKPSLEDQEIKYTKTAGTWDSDNNTWNFQVKNGYAQAYETIHPFYVVFTGSFQTTAYQGYAIIRVCPRIAYNSSTASLEIVCESEIIDSCNSNSMTKSSTVSVDVSVNDKSYTSVNVVYTIKVSGFSSHRGDFRVVDPFAVVSREYV